MLPHRVFLITLRLSRCASPFSDMSNSSRSFVASDEPEKVGPDYFGYYSREVINLLSQDEEFLPLSTPTSGQRQHANGGVSGKNTIPHSNNRSDQLYRNGIEAGLSDYGKDRLRSLLRQGVTILSSEVDEILDPVLAMHDLQLRLRSKKLSPSNTAAASADDEVQAPCKKIKVSNSSFATNLVQISDVNPHSKRKGDGSQLSSHIGLEKENKEVDNDVIFLLENDTVQVEEIVKKYSDELSGKLSYMEQQLELLLDVVMLKCRPMTLVEKQQLQKLIQKLPPRNLDRVVEIICRSKPAGKRSGNHIDVDLDKEDNVTLWRLYYYVEAVEKAKRLSCSQEA